MARPTVIRDEDLLAAAREVFLVRGIRATTAEVAKRAGVSEGTLFKRFHCKVDLFRAAMMSTLEEPPFYRTLERLVGVGCVRESLQQIGLELTEFFEEIAPLMMMAWSNPGPDGVPAVPRGPDSPPLKVLDAVVAFFRAEMNGNRLREMDPNIVSRAFLGALHNFVVFQKVYRLDEHLPVRREEFVRGLVDLMWNGLRPAKEDIT